MKILVYPKDKNPYQDLLYSAMKRIGKSNIKISYCYNLPIVGGAYLPFYVLWMRLRGYKILHIHWPVFIIRLSIPYKKQISYLLYIFCVKWFKLLGYKIVWTVHNVLPHEAQTANDLSAAQLLSNAADLKILHSKYTIQQMKDNSISTDKTTVIPHGNYIGVYENNIDNALARKELGIKNSDFVILFLGMIRAYKGIEDLLKTFSELEVPNVTLVIAGLCVDDTLKDKINDASHKHNIIFKNGHIPDSELAKYYNASDIVCLPFTAVTTSGSVLLALSFGKAVIAPYEGALKDLPPSVGYLYDVTKNESLKSAIENSIEHKQGIKKMNRNALTYAKSLSWDKIATLTYNRFKDILK